MKCLSSSCGYACHTSGHAHHPTKGPVDFVGWCCGRCRLSDDYTHGPCCEQIRWASNLRELNEEVKRRHQFTPAQRHHEVTEAMMRGQLRQAMMRGHRSDDEGPTSMEVEAHVEEGNDSQRKWQTEVEDAVAKVEEGIDSQRKKIKWQTNKWQCTMAKVKEGTDLEGD